MKKAILFSFLISIFLFLIFSCHCRKKATAQTIAITEVKRDFEKEGYVRATVIYFDLDACRYLLVLANEKRLEPSANLAPEFQQDQLSVWVKYVAKKGGVSACMAGQIVEVSDIHIRK
ncbi:MAG: hypothetical protein EPN85_08040 [Bacteroidetes bacterium]|nr:MAG: hypothetical protein EPN85_08040 [Bacteroidota bacterium]